MTLMLLCAGEGTRLRPHTGILPKPAIPFLTVPLAAYGLAWAKEIAPSRVVVNSFHLPEKIHALFRSLAPPDLKFSNEQPFLMGSGGGIMKAKPHLTGDDFLVMNGDEVFLPSEPGQLAAAAEGHRRSGALATLAVMKYPGVGTAFGGVWVDAANRVLGFGKTKPAGAVTGWHYIGALFLSSRIFNYLPEGEASNILTDGLLGGIARGENVRIAEVRGWWHETGNEKDYLAGTAGALPFFFSRESAEGAFLRALLAKHRPRAQWEKRENAYILQADGSSFPPAGCEGFIVLGENSSLREGTSNENAVLGDGVHAPGGVRNALLLA